MAKSNTLDYNVLLKEADFQLRSYQDFFIVEYKNIEDPNMDLGFRTLFRYISSDNQKDKKIAMTTPVILNKSDSVKKIAFVALEKNLKDIISPNNPNLNIKKLRLVCLRHLPMAVIQILTKKF